MPLLEVDHVDVFYGDFQAISGVSLSLAAGEVLAFYGEVLERRSAGRARAGSSP